VNITYSKPLTAVVRALGLQTMARKAYYAVRRPPDCLLSLGILGRTCKFRAEGPVELRTVELTFESEREILELILSEIRSGDSFLDVGANLGMFSVFAAAFGARVIAFEPEPIALQRLMTNREANGLDFQIISKALSDEEKEVSFSSATSSQVIQNSHISERGTHKVKCIPGDSLGLHPDVAKIDVEGHEIHVLRGLHSSLDLCRLCVVEVHEGVDWNSVERVLRSYKFTGFERLHGKLVGRR